MAGSSAKPLFAALVIFLYLPFAWQYGWLLLPGGTVDYPSYHYAAVMAFEEGKTPYGPAAFDEATAELGGKVHPFLYPPPTLLALWPLAKLSFSAGKTALILASHLSYLWAIWLLLTRLTPLPADGRLRDLTIVVSLVYLFLFDPAIVTLGIGQINLIVLPFLFLALAAMRRNAAAWQIALPLSLAILLKTYPVLLFLPLLFRKQFKAIALTCVFFWIYTAIAALVLPADVWSTWLRFVVPNGGYTANIVAAGAPWNQNINAFVCRLFLENERSQTLFPYPPLAKPLATLMALAVAALTAFFAFRAARRSPDRAVGDCEIAAFLLMIFLIAPLSWEHHLVYILPATIIAIKMLVANELRWREALLVAAALFLTGWRVPFWDPALSRGWWTLLISIKFYAAVVLWIFFLNRLRALPPTVANLPATR